MHHHVTHVDGPVGVGTSWKVIVLCLNAHQTAPHAQEAQYSQVEVELIQETPTNILGQPRVCTGEGKEQPWWPRRRLCTSRQHGRPACQRQRPC